MEPAPVSVRVFPFAHLWFSIPQPAHSPFPASAGSITSNPPPLSITPHHHQPPSHHQPPFSPKQLAPSPALQHTAIFGSSKKRVYTLQSCLLG
mmetsp:Transcript_29119/g.64355  ORF Transcript_29119/g.64355 Transcript_29119/m.64355 type:complete len:93 (+) Transcript_29119:504-782(+)